MKNHTWKIIVSTLLITILAALVLVPQARAQGIIYGDDVPAGQTVERNIILIGDRITIDGDVDGDVLAVGSNITINGEISGSLVTAGRNITHNGKVDGSTYAASLTQELGEAAMQGRDLYYIGVQLTLQPGAQINRDLLAISLGATLGGNVGRNLRAIIGPLDIFNAFLQMTQGKTLQDVLNSSSSNLAAAELAAAADLVSGISPLSKASIPAVGSWRHPQYAVDRVNLRRSSFQQLTSAESNPAREVLPQTGRIDTPRLLDWLSARLRDWVTLLVFGGLAMLLFKRWFEPWVEKVRSAPLVASAWGLVVVVFGFSAAFLAAMLILPIALFFFALTLTDLGASWLAVGYLSLGLVFTIFLIFVIYISKAIVAYLVGKLILDRLAPPPATPSMRYRVLPLLLGTFIYILVIALPILGWVFGIIATLLGMGAIWMTLRERRIVVEETALTEL